MLLRCFGSIVRDYPSIWVSPQIEIACPEIVLPRGLHMNRIWLASCSGVTSDGQESLAALFGRTGALMSSLRDQPA